MKCPLCEQIYFHAYALLGQWDRHTQPHWLGWLRLFDAWQRICLRVRASKKEICIKRLFRVNFTYASNFTYPSWLLSDDHWSSLRSLNIWQNVKSQRCLLLRISAIETATCPKRSTTSSISSGNGSVCVFLYVYSVLAHMHNHLSR